MVALRASALACLWFALGVFGPANAGNKTAVEIVGSNLQSTIDTTARPQNVSGREVEVVVVWGFRIRSTQYELRQASVRGGYSELVSKADCQTSTCGFVVVPDGEKWRATNVIAASEQELLEMKRNMERDGTVLVVVYPNGEKRSVPDF